MFVLINSFALAKNTVVLILHASSSQSFWQLVWILQLDNVALISSNLISGISVDLNPT